MEAALFIGNGSLPPLYKSKHVAPRTFLPDSAEESEIKDILVLLSFVPPVPTRSHRKRRIEQHLQYRRHSRCKQPSAQARGGGIYSSCRAKSPKVHRSQLESGSSAGCEWQLFNICDIRAELQETLEFLCPAVLPSNRWDPNPASPPYFSSISHFYSPHCLRIMNKICHLSYIISRILEWLF